MLCYNVACTLYLQQRKHQMMMDYPIHWNISSSWAVSSTHTRVFWICWLTDALLLEQMLGQVENLQCNLLPIV